MDPSMPQLRNIKRPHSAELIARVFLGVAVLSGAACSMVSSTTKRSAAVGLGAAAGAAGGYFLSDKDPAVGLAGAAVGGTLTNLTLGEDPVVRQEGFDQGYVHGQSDAIKRQYFLRQALETQPLTPQTNAGETVYYVIPGPEVTADGRKLEPHQVAVRVVE